jgi:hypothetical protein
MRRRQELLWFLVSSAALVCAQPQKPEVADPVASSFFVRFQRTTSGRDVCAIVRIDGLFHLEEETANRVDVVEGTLDQGELATLKTDLGKKELADLTQQNIPVPLVISEHDVFQLRVLRPTFTQTLSFPDPQSRGPFREFINPLLQWLSLLQKRSHTELDEYSGRNNCLPPHKIEFSSREAKTQGREPSPSRASNPAGSTPDISPPTSPAPFLMRWHFNDIARKTVEDMCVVVYLSGQFRLEKSKQSVGGNLKMRAFEGSLDENDLRQLKELLDEPKLRSSAYQNVSNWRSFTERELTILTIPRDREIQQLRFASYFGVPDLTSNIRFGTDPEEDLVSPLRKWVKSHIESRKLDALPNALATRCIAAPPTKQP